MGVYTRVIAQLLMCFSSTFLAVLVVSYYNDLEVECVILSFLVHKVAGLSSSWFHLARSFDLLFRKNPFGGEYTVFAGLEECVRFAANLKFRDDDIEYLKTIMPSTCEVSRISQLHNS